MAAENIIPKIKAQEDTELIPDNVHVEKLVTNSRFVETVTNRICEIILNNDKFKQTICDSISLDLMDDINVLKLKDSKKIITESQIRLEHQKQYSRRNCLNMACLLLRRKTLAKELKRC